MTPEFAHDQEPRGLLEMPLTLMTLKLTAFMLLLHGGGGWILEVPLRLICVWMLLSPTALRSQRVWLSAAFLLTLVHANHWYSIDNHKYLMTYWTITVAVGVGAANTASVLANNARLLIGLCFGFATFWKFYAGEYLDGSFLHSVFLTDGRVTTPMAAVGGVLEAELENNRAMLSLLTQHPSDDAFVSLATSARLEGIALVSSYWTLFIEGLIAILFLWPGKSRRWMMAQDAALLVFLATTYVLLPVAGFATLLAIMALSRRTGPHSWRVVYISILVLIQLTRIPWQDYAAIFVE